MTTAHAPTGINTASLLEARAAQLPDKIALVHDGDRITFAQLDETINRFANYFRARGIKKGHKVVLFIQPSIEFSAVTFALFKLGAVPVFIDPGMGVKNLRGAVAQVTPDALIAIPKGLMLAKVFRKDFASAGIKLNATKLRAVTKDESASFDKYLAPADEMAAILFTSGGTGTPKGVVYTHQIFINQTQMLQEMFDLTPEDVDFPCFSLFGFFTLAMGLTSHIPPINPTKLQDLDPRELVNMMKQHKVTFAAG
ncbi:MAG: AMP-binding protein, partial [Coriobacteriia bacterium]|nr:AMP-binding protein [Coriobacteriia bacterium]